MNVFIRSTLPAGETLDTTSFDFRILSGPRRLDFLDSSSPASDPTFANANYVFAGNSLDFTNSVPLGARGTPFFSVPNDRFIGGDGTNTGGVTATTTNKLLGELPITTVTSLAPRQGTRSRLAWSRRQLPASAATRASQTAVRDGTTPSPAVPEP